MDKKRRHLINYKVATIGFLKKQYTYLFLKNIKFNRNILNVKHIYFQFFVINSKFSISHYKNICLTSGYKRSIIKKFTSSRFISNKLAKHGLLVNYKP